MWQLEFVSKASEELAALDNNVAIKIIKRLEWLISNFDTTYHQRLTGELKDFYKLRVGDYRILYQFDRESQIILVLKIGPRDKIYK